jgi:hypothetical protein
MEGWTGPPWGLLPQDAGQCEGRGLRLHRVPLKFRCCVKLAEGGCRGRAGSPAGPSGHAPTASGLSKPIAGSAGQWGRQPVSVNRQYRLWGRVQETLKPNSSWVSSISLMCRFATLNSGPDGSQLHRSRVAWWKCCKNAATCCDFPACEIHGSKPNAREKQMFCVICLPPSVLTAKYRGERRLPEAANGAQSDSDDLVGACHCLAT